MKTTYTLNTIETTLHGLKVILTHIDTPITERITIRSAIHTTQNTQQDYFFNDPTQPRIMREIFIQAEQHPRAVKLFGRDYPDLAPTWCELRGFHDAITHDPQKVADIIKYFLIQQQPKPATATEEVHL
jgi:uncharacterized protein with HEPN domain